MFSSPLYQQHAWCLSNTHLLSKVLQPEDTTPDSSCFSRLPRGSESVQDIKCWSMRGSDLTLHSFVLIRPLYAARRRHDRSMSPEQIFLFATRAISRLVHIRITSG